MQPSPSANKGRLSVPGNQSHASIPTIFNQSLAKSKSSIRPEFKPGESFGTLGKQSALDFGGRASSHVNVANLLDRRRGTLNSE